MTEEYIEIRTQNGTYIPFELENDHDGPVQAGRRLDDAVDRAGETLEAGIDRAREIARSVAARMSSLPSPHPDRVGVEIGLKVSAAAGVVVARASTEAHVKVTVEWQHSPTESTAQNNDESTVDGCDPAHDTHSIADDDATG